MNVRNNIMLNTEELLMQASTMKRQNIHLEILTMRTQKEDWAAQGQEFNHLYLKYLACNSCLVNFC